MRNEISKRIDELMSKYSMPHTEHNAAQFNQEIAFTQDRLYESLNSTDAFDTKDQLSSYIFEDKDPISRAQTQSVSDIDSFVEKVRDIQNDILDEFVEFRAARGIDLLKTND